MTLLTKQNPVANVFPHGAAITFDFHNTLVHCDEWFTLEIRTLVSAFLQWKAEQRGELINTELITAADSAYRSLREDIQRHGNELSAEMCIATVLPQIGETASDREIEHGVDLLMRHTLQQATPVPGAVDTVHALHQAGATLGIVSSAVYHPFLVWALEQFHMLNAFQVVTTSASVGYYKSRPEIYWQTLSQLHAEARLSLHVGDSLRYDVHGAQRAGMRAVWFNNDNKLLSQDTHPDLTITSLGDAAPALIKLLRAGAA